MKKLLSVTSLFVMLVAVPLTGCTDGAGNDLHPEQTYKIVVIDSCEYIFVSRRPFSGEFALAHKGNCKFCEQRRHGN